MNAAPALVAPALSPSSAARGKATQIALWIGQILFAALFIFGGVNKIFGLMQEMVDNFARMGVGVWFRYLVGALELTGGVGLLIPSLAGVAAMELICVMIGAVLTHLFVQPPAYMAVGPAVIGSLLALIAYARRDEIRAAIARVRA